MATVTRSFELSVEAAAALDRRAMAADCAPSEVLNHLLLIDDLPGEELRESDFTPEQWKRILVGEAQADAGLFATPEEVEAVLSRFRGPA